MSVETAKKAMEDLSFCMQIDPDYAWAWHCNLAVMAQDAGATHEESNKRAADFMRRTFNVDTTQPPIKPTSKNIEFDIEKNSTTVIENINGNLTINL